MLPILEPYEFSLYLLLLRATDFTGGEVRIGKRTISARLGKGTRSSQGNYQHITEKLIALAEAGFIAIGGTTREGTQYRVVSPGAVPSVREVIATSKPPEKEPDYFTDPVLRSGLMERDQWTCRYCGELVTTGTATLDHIVPQSLGGHSCCSRSPEGDHSGVAAQSSEWYADSGHGPDWVRRPATLRSPRRGRVRGLLFKITDLQGAAMSKMRAARMHGYKQPLRLEENSDPRYRARRIVGFKGRPTVR